MDPERFELSSKQGISELSTKFRINLVFDSSQAFIQTRVIEPLASRQVAQRDEASSAAATSKVEFFTFFRGAS